MNALGGMSLLLLLGAGCGRPTGPAVSYRTDTVLIGIDAEGREAPVPVPALGVESDIPAAIVVSPDKKHVLYTRWEIANMSLYIADLPGLTNPRKIAAQSVPEGRGKLDAGTLAWIDGRTIQYRENGVACGETGGPSTINPTKDCDGGITATYRVDILTGVKTMTDKWMETIKPLQP